MQKPVRILTCLILGFMLLNLSNIAWSQPDSHSPLFQVYGDGPIISHGAPGEWDSTYNDPGSVIFHDGKFHMLRNGLQSLANGGASIGYLTSANGLDWDEVSEEPVMTTADVPYTTITAQIGTTFVTEDGMWVMYFHVLDTARFPISGGSIGRATAASPFGPWVPDDEPLLRPGTSGSWDDMQVSHPRVVRNGDQFHLYYSGYNSSGIMAIGLAFSDDGIHWIKYDDPVTADARLAESDPVLVASEHWEYSSLQHPSVVLSPDGWIMIYRAPGPIGTLGRLVGLGLATSNDGIHWDKYSDNPVMVPSDLPNGQWIWFSGLTYHEGTYFLYMEGSTRIPLGGITDVYAATFEGNLPPNN